MEKSVPYPPTEYHNHELRQLVEVINATKFSTIFFCEHPDLDAVFAPLFIPKAQQELIAKGELSKVTLFGHLHKYNYLRPLLEAKPQVQVRIVFNCADCYVSPSVYEKKQKTHEVVPTWNYVVAQLTGQISLIQSIQQFKQILEEEVDQFESAVGSHWRLKDAPESYVNGLLGGIFGVRVDIQKFTVHKKLHQRNTPRNDVANVTEWVGSATPERRLLKPWMQDVLASMPK